MNCLICGGVLIEIHIVDKDFPKGRPKWIHETPEKEQECKPQGFIPDERVTNQNNIGRRV